MNVNFIRQKYFNYYIGLYFLNIISQNLNEFIVNKKIPAVFILLHN